MIIGFCTGSLYKLINSTKESIGLIKASGANAIELCGGHKERFDADKENFMLLEKQDLENFEHVSLHAPWGISYAKNSQTHKLLTDIKRIHDRLDFDLIIFHPDIIKDFSIFLQYSFPIAFENMDKRKRDMRTPEELEKIFQNNEFGFVLDLTHAYMNDSTMNLAEKLIDKFADRIKEVHCSGYYAKVIGGVYEGTHSPAFLERDFWQRDYNLPNEKILSPLSALCKKCPIIIESIFPKETPRKEIVASLKKELEYIKSFT